jgi:hypothetical protein
MGRWSAQTSLSRQRGRQRRQHAYLDCECGPCDYALSYAYDVPVKPSPRLSPLPDWTLREKYDIEAKAPANAMPPVFRTAKYEAEFSK